MSECKYCETLQSKKNLVYEDETMLIVVPEKTLCAGHLQIIPKKHHINIQQIEDEEISKLFYAASFAASTLFEGLEAHGTNIIANTGSMIKESGHFHIDVIARKSGDDINFLWKPMQADEEEIKSVQGKIKDKCDMIGIKKTKEVIDLDKPKAQKLETKQDEKKETPKEAAKNEPKKEEKKKDIKENLKEDNESYLIRQLRRLP